MEEHNGEPLNVEDLLRRVGPYDPKLDLSGYQYPPIDLLPEQMRLLLQHFREKAFTLPLLLNVEPNAVFRELYHHPNVLLAGTIAAGKTQFIYNQLISWLYIYHPAELKWVICRSKPIDYNAIAKLERHFLAKLPSEPTVIAEGRQVVKTIDGLAMECDARLALFREAGVKTIRDYNDRFVNRRLNPEEGHRYLPNIVLILDDLYTFLDAETLTSLVRLTQQNLYTGIYLIAVTSQIMARNISPQLRANFSVRVAMKLMSQNESRKILDRVGAEKLSGAGEVLYEESGKLQKGTQPLIDYETITAISEFIASQRGYPSAMLLPEFVEDSALHLTDFDLNDRDSMFEEAARLVVLHQQGSTSLIQRKLKVGYERSGRIIDQLEAAGIVGPFEGSKAREVLFPDEYSLAQFLGGLNNGDTKENGTPETETVKANGGPVLPKQVNDKPTSIRATKSNPVTAAKSSKKIPPSKEDKKIAKVIVWIIVVFVGLLIYLTGGWDGLLNWLK